MMYLLTLLACGDGEAPPATPPSATPPPAEAPPASPPPTEAPSSPPAPAGEAPDKPTPKPPGPEPTTPGARCVHSAPAAADGWRKATPEDVIPDLREHTKCQAISGDFDRNGTSDTAVLEVHSDKRQSRLRIILSNGTELIARDWPMVPESLGGLAPTIFNPKSAAEDVARDNISDEAKEGLKERDAIEVCYGGDEGTPLSEQDASDLCYCSEFWLVDKGAAVKHLVCD